MANKNRNIDTYFERFDADIKKYIKGQLQEMANRVSLDMKREATLAIDRFYADYTIPGNGHYLLFVPYQFPEVIPNSPVFSMDMLIDVYWRRKYNLYQAIKTSYGSVESSKKQGLYRFKSQLVLDSKYMDQSVHRMNVADVLTRSFELGIHGFGRNDVIEWKGKKTNWYLPSEKYQKVQPYKKRGYYYMERWQARYYKKNFLKGTLRDIYLEKMVNRIASSLARYLRK